MIVKIDTHKSFGGRATGDQWCNTYFAAIDGDLASQGVRELGEYIASAEKTAHLSEVHFMRTHIVQLAENTWNRPDNRFVTIEHEFRGDRDVNYILDSVAGTANALENPMLPKEICVVVKRQASEGRNGRMFYRSCLLNDDVKTGNDGKFELKVPTLFSSLGNGTASLVSMLNDPPQGVSFVMPNPAGYFVQTGRTVIAHSLGGVSIVQTTKHRVTSPQALARSIQRQIDHLAKQAADIKAAQEALGQTTAGSTEFERVVDLAQALIKVVPVGKGAGVTLPDILALPAGI